jgi:hypothetical protein
VSLVVAGVVRRPSARSLHPRSSALILAHLRAFALILAHSHSFVLILAHSRAFALVLAHSHSFALVVAVVRPFVRSSAARTRRRAAAPAAVRYNSHAVASPCIARTASQSLQSPSLHGVAVAVCSPVPSPPARIAAATGVSWASLSPQGRIVAPRRAVVVRRRRRRVVVRSFVRGCALAVVEAPCAA